MKYKTSPGLGGVIILGWLMPVLAVLLAGCVDLSSTTPPPPRTLPGPLKPMTNPALEQSLGPANLIGCPDTPREPAPDEPIADLVLQYVGDGRDFYTRGTPDGFVLRVSPLDREYRTIHARRDMVITLLEANPSPPTLQPRPLRIWYISGRELDKYWTSSRLLDGYLFRLDWGEKAIPAGDYFLVARLAWRQAGRIESICQEIAFQDLTTR